MIVIGLIDVCNLGISVYLSLSHMWLVAFLAVVPGPKLACALCQRSLTWHSVLEQQYQFCLSWSCSSGSACSFLHKDIAPDIIQQFLLCDAAVCISW